LECGKGEYGRAREERENMLEKKYRCLREKNGKREIRKEKVKKEKVIHFKVDKTYCETRSASGTYLVLAFNNVWFFELGST
jgi:hypothetical protein